MQCILVKSDQFDNSSRPYFSFNLFLESRLCCCSLAAFAPQQLLLSLLFLCDSLQFFDVLLGLVLGLQLLISYLLLLLLSEDCTWAGSHLKQIRFSICNGKGKGSKVDIISSPSPTIITNQQSTFSRNDLINQTK